jgi:hypothetical protein
MNKLLPLLFLILAPFTWAQAYSVTSAQITNYADLAAPTTLTLSDEDLSASISPAGFSFDYFGQTYTSFKVGSNGYLILGSAGTHNTYVVYHDTAPGLFVAPLWADFAPGGGSSIGWEYTGGLLTVEWRELRTTWGGSATQPVPRTRMQALLDTASGEVSFRYGTPSTTYNGNWGNYFHNCAISGPSGQSQEIVDGVLTGFVSGQGWVQNYPANQSITFAPQLPPTINSTPVTTAMVGQAYAYTVTANGSPASYQAQGGSDQQSFSITVDPAPVPPMITSTAPTNVVVGSFYSYQVVATGSPAPSFSTGALPGWLSLSGDLLSGTPVVGDIGANGPITITATNSAGTDNQTFSITVDPQVVAPQITSVPVTAAVVGNTYSYQVTATGSPTPAISAGGLPAWLSLSGSTLSGTPTSAGTTGIITITATNSGGSDQQQFQITITDNPTPPAILSSPAAEVEVGELYSYTLTASGSPAPSVVFSGLPAWLTHSGNTISGMPGSGDVGATGLITATATNASGTDSQQFSVVVKEATLKSGGNGGGGGGGCVAGAGGASLLGLIGLMAFALRRSRR